MVEGGTAHGYTINDQLLSMGCPLPPYIKEQGGEAAGQERGMPGEVLLPPGVGLPPFLVGLGEGGKEDGERKEKGGRRPPLLVLFGLGGGARGPALAASPLLHKGPLWPIKPPGGSGNPSVLR